LGLAIFQNFEIMAVQVGDCLSVSIEDGDIQRDHRRIFPVRIRTGSRAILRMQPSSAEEENQKRNPGAHEK
jgi:hypothetical protein